MPQIKLAPVSGKMSEWHETNGYVSARVCMLPMPLAAQYVHMCDCGLGSASTVHMGS